MNVSSELAYAIGMISTDGNLSKDGRHLDITSQDLGHLEQLEGILKTKNKIGIKSSPCHNGRIYYRLQFSNVVLYRFLVSIGISPAKSKTIEHLKIQDAFFADFLRGCFDGDGYCYSYWDKRWPSSFCFYSGLVSASCPFLEWIKHRVEKMYGLEGKIKGCGKSAFQLMYAKNASIKLYNILYYDEKIICLKRKRYKFERILGIISNYQAGMAKW